VTLDADGTARPLVSRTFDSFTEAKLENAQSRIYLGIHWAFDRDDGIKTGDQVADYVFEHYFEARRVRPPRDYHSSSEIFNSQRFDGESTGAPIPLLASAPAETATPSASTGRTAPLMVDTVMSQIGEDDRRDDRLRRRAAGASADFASALNTRLVS
jgi:hypothetical protein